MVPTKLLLLALLVFLTYGTPAKPPINWNPSSVSQTVLIGTTSSVEVTFTAAQPLSNVSVRVVPELAAFIAVSPSEYSAIPADVPQTITLLFSVPKGTPIETLVGAIQLRGEGGINPKPLPVILQTRAASSTEIPATVALPSADRIDSVAGPESVEFVNDEIDVFVKPGTEQSEVISLAVQIGGSFLGSIPEDRMYQIEIGQLSFQGLTGILNLVRQNPNVELAIHHYLYGNSNVPNDLGYQVSYAPPLINLPAAWDTTIGSKSFGVAVVDSRFDNGNADLQSNITKAAVNTGPLNIFHGTMVAGIIGATGNNNIGIAGVMWQASLYLYSTSTTQNAEKTDGLLTIRSVGDAIRNGVRVLNRSAGIACAQIICTQDEVSALEEEDSLFVRFFQTAKQQNRDILWVFSAGNGAGNHGPGVTVQRSSPARLSASFPNVVSVSAVDSGKNLASFSNYGKDVTVAAPGVSILSLAPGGVLTEDSGTSFAAPYVAGVAGLMLSVDPHLSSFELKTTVHYSAASTGNFDAEGNEVLLLDAAHAVQVAKSAFYFPDGTNFVTINMPFARRPDRFPADLRLEDPGQAVTQNYVAASSDGKFQQTRVFNTTRDLNGAIDNYKNYFISHGWSLLADVSIPNFRVVAFQKGDQIMDVQMNLLPFKSIAIDLSVVPQV